MHRLQILHKESVGYKWHVLIPETTPDTCYWPKLQI